MPSTYAHYCFGKAVYRRLPQEIQEEIKAYSPLYMTGLHGPDILFYYNAWTNCQLQAEPEMCRQ